MKQEGQTFEEMKRQGMRHERKGGERSGELGQGRDLGMERVYGIIFGHHPALVLEGTDVKISSPLKQSGHSTLDLELARKSFPGLQWMLILVAF